MRDFRRAGWPAQALRLSLGVGTAGLCCAATCCRAQSLPDAPSVVLTAMQPALPAASQSGQQPGGVAADGSSLATGHEQKRAAVAGQGKPPACERGKPTGSPPAGGAVIGQDKTNADCTEKNPLQPIVAAHKLPALNAKQKGFLAIRDVIDPFNLITVIGYSGIEIGANSHTAYGPGFRGFGRLAGYSMVEDVQGEFFGTFAIPTLVHQDPRYYREPDKPFVHRLLHAVSHTVVTRNDDGSPMPNYATLLTYPISAELTNLYVPGVAVNAPSTAKRIALGLSTDPVGQIVAEFLPDVAKRIHIRVIFVQQIIQQVAQGSTNGPVMTQ